MDNSDPEIRAEGNFEICVFELSNASTDTPDTFKPTPCYLLTNLSLTGIQIFWYNPGRADDMTSYTVVEDLGAQYFVKFREPRVADLMFRFLYHDRIETPLRLSFAMMIRGMVCELWTSRG